MPFPIPIRSRIIIKTRAMTLKEKEKNKKIYSQTKVYRLQQSLAKGTAHQRAAGSNSLLRSGFSSSKAGVHLDQVNGNQVASCVDRLADVVALTQGQASSDGSAGARSPHGVEGIHVERQVDGGVVANVGKGHLHDATNSVSARGLAFGSFGS